MTQGQGHRTFLKCLCTFWFCMKPTDSGSYYLSQSCTSCTLSSSRRWQWGLRRGRGCCRRENLSLWLPLCFLLSAFRRWLSPERSLKVGVKKFLQVNTICKPFFDGFTRFSVLSERVPPSHLETLKFRLFLPSSKSSVVGTVSDKSHHIQCSKYCIHLKR